MKVEVLTFEGCPNALSARELVERVLAESRIPVDVAYVNVPDPEAAERLRFLGSPTIRVEGSDIEPGADQRTAYVLACRIYRTERGATGVPDARWLRDALAA